MHLTLHNKPLTIYGISWLPDRCVEIVGNINYGLATSFHGSHFSPTPPIPMPSKGMLKAHIYSPLSLNPYGNIGKNVTPMVINLIHLEPYVPQPYMHMTLPSSPVISKASNPKLINSALFANQAHMDLWYL